MASFTRLSLIVLMVAMLAALTTVSYAVTIETVPVGNAGNDADPGGTPPTGGQTSWTWAGAVDYNYKIAKYAVSNAQYAEFLNAVADTDTYGLYNAGMGSSDHGGITQSGSSGSYAYATRTDGQGGSVDMAKRPVAFVSFGDMTRFANWMHNGQPTGAQGLTTTEDGAYFLDGATTDAELLAVDREADWKWALTSKDEWYKAALYDPTPADHDEDGGTPDTVGYWDYATASDTQPAGVSGGTLPDTIVWSQSFAADVDNSGGLSAYGTMGQSGNVWELTETSAEEWVTGGPHPDSLYWMGLSAWDTYPPHAMGLGTYANPAFEDNSYYLGFRVAEIPEPGSITLLGCGLLGLALVARRKRRR